MDILGYEFMQNAVMAGVLASILCGIIGSLIVVNRLVFLSGGIAHSAYGGIGLAFYMGWPYMLGASGFALLSGMIMAAVSLRAKHRSDTIIGVIWALGMAMGILLLDLTPGYNVDLMSYLFGSILSVPTENLSIMAGAGLLIILTVGFFFSDFWAMSYDEEFAQVRGVPVQKLYFLLIGLVSLTVVMVVQLVGLILVIALLTIPAHIAEKYTKSLPQMMLLACLLGICFVLGGLWISYRYDLTSGATIIALAGSAFFISMLIQQLKHILHKQRIIRAHRK